MSSLKDLQSQWLSHPKLAGTTGRGPISTMKDQGGKKSVSAGLTAKPGHLEPLVAKKAVTSKKPVSRSGIAQTPDLENKNKKAPSENLDSPARFKTPPPNVVLDPLTAGGSGSPATNSKKGNVDKSSPPSNKVELAPLSNSKNVLGTSVPKSKSANGAQKTQEITPKTKSSPPPESHMNLSTVSTTSTKKEKDLKANVDQSLIPADLSDHCTKFLDTKHDDEKRVARWEKAERDGGKRFSYDDATQGDIEIMVRFNRQHSSPTHVYTNKGSCSGCDHIVTLELPDGGTVTFNDWYENVGPASGEGVTWKHSGTEIYGTEHTGDAWEGGGDRSWGNQSKVKALAVLICEAEGLPDDLQVRCKFLKTLPLCGNTLSSCLADASL